MSIDPRFSVLSTWMAPKGYIPDGASSRCFIAKFVTRCLKAIHRQPSPDRGRRFDSPRNIIFELPGGKPRSNLTLQAERNRIEQSNDSRITLDSQLEK